eukprot:scaffold29645_cov16-Prasinocladus_malaysianus.AAC.1
MRLAIGKILIRIQPFIHLIVTLQYVCAPPSSHHAQEHIVLAMPASSSSKLLTVGLQIAATLRQGI